MIKAIFYLPLILLFCISLQSSAAVSKLSQADQAKLKKARELTKQSMKNKKESNVDSILASVNGTPISLSDVLYESRRTEARLGMVYSGQQQYDEVIKLRKQILEDIEDAQIINLVPDVIEDTIELLENNKLRSLDALHIACALVWRADLFVTADKRQTQAARNVGLRTRLLSEGVL